METLTPWMLRPKPSPSRARKETSAPFTCESHQGLQGRPDGGFQHRQGGRLCRRHLHQIRRPQIRDRDLARRAQTRQKGKGHPGAQRPGHPGSQNELSFVKPIFTQDRRRLVPQPPVFLFDRPSGPRKSTTGAFLATNHYLPGLFTAKPLGERAKCHSSTLPFSSSRQY